MTIDLILMAVCVIIDAVSGGAYLAMSIFAVEDGDGTRGIVMATSVVWIATAILCMVNLFRIAGIA